MLKQIIVKLNDPQIAGQLRHGLSLLGGVLASKGVVDDISWELYLGLLLAFLAFAGSWLAPEKVE